MKRLLFLLLPVLLFACKSNNYDSLFKEYSNFPYVVDSLFISSFDEANYKSLDATDLKSLYRDVKKFDTENANNIERIIEIDSLRKENISEEEINKMYGHYKEPKIFALHKLQLKSGIKAYSWYISIDSGDYIFLDQVYVTLFKNNKAYSCFRLGLISMANLQAKYFDDTDEGEIYENGIVKRKKYHSENDDQGYFYERVELNELLIKEGEVELVKTEDVKIPPKENKEEEKVSDYTKFDAVTVGNGTKLYSDASFESNVVRKCKTGELLKILSQTDKREKDNTGTQCGEYGYFWYKIKDSNSAEAWVYGKNLFKIYQNTSNDVYNKDYRVEDNFYKFGYASDLSYGPTDDYGLTGCAVFYLPFFYNEGGKTIMPVHYEKDKFESERMDWSSSLFDEGILFFILKSEGGHDSIDEVNPTIYDGIPSFELIVTHWGQDGSTKSKIYVADENYKMELIGYEHEK